MDPENSPTNETPTNVSSDDGGLIEWVLRRKAAERVRSSHEQASPREYELHRRATLALEAGDRILAPISPFEAGTGAPLAIQAYRQSIHWSLALRAQAHGEEKAPRPLAELWQETEDAVEAQRPPNSSERLRELLTRDYTKDAEDAEAVQIACAQLLQEFATSLVRTAEGPEKELRALQRQRLLRGAGLILLLGLLLFGAVKGGQVLLKKPDLAAGKPWRASSSSAQCFPEKHTCGSNQNTRIFFHTNRDDSPWLEIDLGAPTAFSAATVENRSDCCQERAIPLVFEVSNDAKSWTELARQGELFSTWKPKFAPQKARYVRVRVAAKSWLHLDRVSIHP